VLELGCNYSGGERENMPARDKIHESVKKALTKDGWTITYDPFRIDYQELTLFADLAAERIDGDQIEYKIVIEIKSFIGPERSLIFEVIPQILSF
jgi:hypothetical protein